jgi:hypothetical protein
MTFGQLTKTGLPLQERKMTHQQEATEILLA